MSARLGVSDGDEGPCEVWVEASPRHGRVDRIEPRQLSVLLGLPAIPVTAVRGQGLGFYTASWVRGQGLGL